MGKAKIKVALSYLDEVERRYETLLPLPCQRFVALHLLTC
jgi:hypothetical protein